MYCNNPVNITDNGIEINFDINDLPNLDQNEYAYLYNIVNKKYHEYYRLTEQFLGRNEVKETRIANRSICEKKYRRGFIYLDATTLLGNLLSKFRIYNYKAILNNPLAFKVLMKANNNQCERLLLLYKDDYFLKNDWFLEIISEIIDIDCDIEYFYNFIHYTTIPPLRGEERIIRFLTKLYLEKNFELMHKKMLQYWQFYEPLNESIHNNEQIKLLFWRWSQPFMTHQSLFMSKVLLNDKSLTDIFFRLFYQVFEEQKRIKKASSQTKPMPTQNDNKEILLTPINRTLTELAKSIIQIDNDKELLFLIMHIKSKGKKNPFNSPIITEKILNKILMDNNARIGLELLLGLDNARRLEEPFFELMEILLRITSAEQISSYQDFLRQFKALLQEEDGYHKAYNAAKNLLKSHPDIITEKPSLQQYMKRRGRHAKNKEATS